MASKGITVHGEMFWIIILILAIMVLAAVYFLMTSYFSNYVVNNINSEIKICEAFEKSPLFGTIKCPG